MVILNDGTDIPWLAFGTGTAVKRLEGREATKLVQLAIANGITHFDGAQLYNNEEALGSGIKTSGKSRSELYVVTKLNVLAPGQTVKDTLIVSLAKLGLDYVDLFLIHTPRPSNTDGSLGVIWRGMEEVKREGLTKSIGVSNFRVEDLKVILDEATIIPAVNQIELHPYVWKAAEPIVAFGQKNGIITAAYGGQTPLARVVGGPLEAILPDISDRLEKTRGKPVSPGQVLFKWILQRGAPIVVTTTTKDSRMKEFLDTTHVPNLTEEELRVIDSAGEQYHKRIYVPHIFGE